VTLEGVGPITVIKGTDKFDVATDLIANKHTEGDSHISIRNLQVVGDWTKSAAPPVYFTGASAIRLTNANDVTIRDVLVRDSPGSGVRLAEKCEHILLDNITSENNAQGVGIHGRSEDVTITNSLIRRNGNGIFLWSENGIISNVRISNNRILEHLFDDGIKIFGAIEYQITGNLIDGTHEGGIEIHSIIEEPDVKKAPVNSGHFIISNNIIRNVDDGYNGGSNGIGIYFGGHAAPDDPRTPIIDFVISNNIIEHTMFGFVSEMVGAGRGVFQGNYVSSAAKGGMHILNTKNFIVDGNVFADMGNYKSVEGYETFGIQVSDVTNSSFTNNIIEDTRENAKFKQEYGFLFRRNTKNITVANNQIIDVQKPMGFLYGADAFLNKNLVVTNGVAAYQERGRPIAIDEVLRTSREGDLQDVQKLSSQMREEHEGAKELRIVNFYEALADNVAGNQSEAQKIFPDVSWGNFHWHGDKVALAPRKEPHEIRARHLDGIKIDGRFDEAAWAKADWQDHFTDFWKNTPVTEKTAVAVGYDNENLYVAYSCSTNPKTLTVKEMENVANVWGDDIAEFFIAPREGRTDAYQFIVNPLGAFYDALNQNAGWESGAKVAVGIGVDCWNVEMAIPLKSLSPSANREGWKINFNRKDKSYAEEKNQSLSTWSFVNGANADVSHFGLLKFE
jgi:hypothetical protein